MLDFIGRSRRCRCTRAVAALVRLDFPTPKRTAATRRGHAGTELPIPPPTSVKQDTGAVEFLVETLRATTEPIALVPVGPLSNIGAALAIDRASPRRCTSVVIMGGGHASGTQTASAEFNIWADPEAADMVFAAGFANADAGAARRDA